MAVTIKKGDRVRVRTGRDKGRVERVLEVLRDGRGRAQKVVVEHVNMIHRHQRQTQKAQGGIVTKEAPIDISNVMLVDPKSNASTRFGAQVDDNGKRIRIAKKSGSPV